MKTKLRCTMMVLILIWANAALAQPIVYTADLAGPNESPHNASPGTGNAVVTIDTVAHLLAIDVTFSGLLGTTTAAHIHGPTPSPGTGTAGVITTVPFFPGFPIGVSSGTYQNTFDTTRASTFNPAFVTAQGGMAGAEAALASRLSAGTAYFNIHTTEFPGGEIRGFLAPVPDPATMLLLGSGLVSLAGIRIRRRLTN